jgi:hypothetical protein
MSKLIINLLRFVKEKNISTKKNQNVKEREIPNFKFARKIKLCLILLFFFFDFAAYLIFSVLVLV